MPKSHKRETVSEETTTPIEEVAPVWVPDGKKADKPPLDKPPPPPERELITHDLSGSQRQHFYCPECGQRKFVRRVISKSFTIDDETKERLEEIHTIELPYEMRGMGLKTRAYTQQLKRGEVWRDRSLFCSVCKDENGEPIKAVKGD